jgi:hypothetical protein
MKKPPRREALSTTGASPNVFDRVTASLAMTASDRTQFPVMVLATNVVAIPRTKNALSWSVLKVPERVFFWSGKHLPVLSAVLLY